MSEDEKREFFGVDGKAAGKKDWGGFGQGKAEQAAPGAEPGKGAPVVARQAGRDRRAKAGDPAKGKGKAKGTAKGSGGGGAFLGSSRTLPRKIGPG